MSDSHKLRKLKEMRLANLERELLDDTLKGYDHYVFINERGKAQVVTEQGRWVAEHIRTAILKFNFQVDETKKKLVKDFSDKEIQAYIDKYDSQIMQTRDKIITAKKRINELETLIRYWSMKKVIEKQRLYQIT